MNAQFTKDEAGHIQVFRTCLLDSDFTSGDNGSPDQAYDLEVIRTYRVFTALQCLDAINDQRV